MKKMTMLFTVLGILFFLNKNSYAYNFTYDVAIGSITVVQISVSSFTATQVDNPSLVKRVAVDVQNIDGSANLWCSSKNNVSSTTGRKIAAGNDWLLPLSDVMGTAGVAVHIYCVNDGGSGATKAAVAQYY